MFNESSQIQSETAITIARRNYVLREQIREELMQEIRLAFASHRMRYDAFNDNGLCLTCGLPHHHEIHLWVGQTAVDSVKEILGEDFPIIFRRGLGNGERDTLIIDMTDMAEIVAGPILPTVCAAE